MSIVSASTLPVPNMVSLHYPPLLENFLTFSFVEYCSKGIFPFGSNRGRNTQKSIFYLQVSSSSTLLRGLTYFIEYLICSLPLIHTRESSSSPHLKLLTLTSLANNTTIKVESNYRHQQFARNYVFLCMSPFHLDWLGASKPKSFSTLVFFFQRMFVRVFCWGKTPYLALFTSISHGVYWPGEMMGSLFLAVNKSLHLLLVMSCSGGVGLLLL